MNRFDDAQERDICELIDRMIVKSDFWALEKPFPSKIGFQRFGLQLREEDFEQNGVPYRGFLLRDRNEVRKYSSGFSVVRNDQKIFEVELDVWPFKRSELSVFVNPGKYFTIKGKHEERLEDGSECSRNFQRYYWLPRGSNSDTIRCNYCNGTLTIRVDKKGVDDKQRGPRTVSITLASHRENETIPINEHCTPVTSADEANLMNNKPIKENSKDVAVANEDLKSRDDVEKVAEFLKDVVIANPDLKSEAVMTVLESYRKFLMANIVSKGDNVPREATILEMETISQQNSNVDGSDIKSQDKYVSESDKMKLAESNPV